jgi:glycosyltransferase involved in cell wall biosynthesis
MSEPRAGPHLQESWLRRVKVRIAARAAGTLTNEKRLSELVAQVLLAQARIRVFPLRIRLEAVLAACRRTENAAMRRKLQAFLRPYLTGPATGVWRAQRVGWGRYYGSFGRLAEAKALTKTLVLKAPGPNGEKGVLYCPFEYNLMRLIAHYDTRAILSEHFVVGASSWSPTDFAALANFAGLSSDPIFIGISHESDVGAYQVMSPVIRPVDIMASDLMDPDFFRPRPHSERSIDILMVANWMRFKRHWLLFEALRHMPRTLRVVLVGRNAPGRTEREIHAEARAFGAKQEIEYLTNVPIHRVMQLQCDAKVSAVFSHREGSCLAITESFFAGTPVAVMADGHVGSKRYINAQTGIVCRRRGLASQLGRFLEESSSYRPREWALGKIDCYTTSARLNELLRRYSRDAGLPWTRDIVTFCRRYVPEYASEEIESTMQPAIEQLRKNHGVELEKFVYRASPGVSSTA